MTTRYQAWKERNRERLRAYQREWAKQQPAGWVTNALSGMRQRSKRRGFPAPEINTPEALRAWLVTTDFARLWDAYAAAGFKTDLRPSIDRLDNTRPYTRDNVRLVTWRENLDAWNKSEAARLNGRRSGLMRRKEIRA